MPPGLPRAFIGLLVLSFAVWGIADIFGGYGGRTVATGGDTKIGYEQFRSTLNTQMQNFGRRFGRTLSLDEARALGIDQNVLTTLIQEAALLNQASNMKLGISDAAIAERITREPMFRDTTGKFSKTVFDQLLAANGLSEARYVASQRDAYVRQQLVQTIASDVELPKALLRAVDVYQNETRKLKYFLLPVDKIDPVGEPTAEAVQKYYDGHKSSYAIPEYRKIGVLALLRPRKSAKPSPSTKRI